MSHETLETARFYLAPSSVPDDGLAADDGAPQVSVVTLGKRDAN
jgi:hypothetical protein